MERLRDYEVVFSGLKNGNHEFSFDIKPSFFQLYATEQEFENCNGIAHVLLEKHTTFLKLIIKVDVKVDLVCDLSNEVFEYPIQNELSLLVNFANEYDDSNEEVISIPFGEHAFNVSQSIYEAIVLSIPMKKISPESEKNKDYYDALLEKFSPNEIEIEEEKDEQEIDPRWAALNALKKK